MGVFTKQSVDKIAEMERMRDAIIIEVQTQTTRIDDRVREINLLKDAVFAQIKNLNERSIGMEKQVLESVIGQGDLITNLNDFGEKQTADIAAL